MKYDASSEKRESHGDRKAFMSECRLCSLARVSLCLAVAIYRLSPWPSKDTRRCETSLSSAEPRIVDCRPRRLLSSGVNAEAVRSGAPVGARTGVGIGGGFLPDEEPIRHSKAALLFTQAEKVCRAVGMRPAPTFVDEPIYV